MSTKKSAKPAEIGYVDLGLVERSDPRTPILQAVIRAIDAADKVNSATAVPPVDLKSVSYIQQVSNLGSFSVKQGLESEQKDKLEAVTTVILDGLNKRLIAAETLSLEAVRIEKLAASRAELSSAAAALQDLAVEQTKQYTADSASIASLKMQISAMKLNETPPPTAPKGYWAGVQAKKESDLAALIAKYDTDLEAIYTDRDKQLAAEKISIDSDIDKEIADSRITAEQKRLSSLSSAKQRFDEEEMQLDQDDGQVLNEAQTVLQSQNVSGIEQTNLGSLRWPAESSQNNTEALMHFRLSLQQSILRDTDKSITKTCDRLHIKIVQRRKGVANLTPTFVQAIEEQDWKVS